MASARHIGGGDKVTCKMLQFIIVELSDDRDVPSSEKDMAAVMPRASAQKKTWEEGGGGGGGYELAVGGGGGLQGLSAECKMLWVFWA